MAVVANHVTGGECSLDPRTDDAVDQRVVVEGNALDGAMLHVKANVRGAVLRDNTADAGAGGVRDGHAGRRHEPSGSRTCGVEHNAGRGWAANGRLLQIDAHPAAALRGFAFDPSANVYQRVAKP